MTKEDYVRNTRQDGLPVELLEYCFDNTVHAPYMFVDGSTDLTAPHQANSLGSTLSSSLTSSKEKAKMEVYQLIMTGQTRRLRVGVQYRIPFKSQSIPKCLIQAR